MSLLSKLKFFIIAILILIVGYFFGAIILIIIAIIIFLIFILFILAILFNKSTNILQNRIVRLFTKMLVSGSITFGLVTLIYKFILSSIFERSNVLIITILWVLSSIIFGTLWNILQIKGRSKLHTNNQIIDYNNIKVGLKVKDVLFMLFISSIITYILNSIFFII